MCTGLVAATGLSTSSLLGVVSMVGQGVGTLMSVRAQQEANYYQQLNAQTQQQQIKDQMEAREVELLSKINERRQDYLRDLSQNRALMAGSGIDLSSPSYRALLKANKKTYNKDVNVLKLTTAEQQLNSARDIQQSKLSAQASKSLTKTQIAGTIGRGLLTAYDTASEMIPRDVGGDG